MLQTRGLASPCKQDTDNGRCRGMCGPSSSTWDSVPGFVTNRGISRASLSCVHGRCCLCVRIRSRVSTHLQGQSTEGVAAAFVTVEVRGSNGYVLLLVERRINVTRALVHEGFQGENMVFHIAHWGDCEVVGVRSNVCQACIVFSKASL